ncbi:hypothetical protein M2M32_07990 [Weissella cibaria]|uniref:hypothetical protein n=1 Tax=Weissella cibaria TaxID=137591 RepID=UPI001CD22712|nr:hypothetical protein [Weissella cibaria]MCA1356226.1 hypothetical protein [Weissella cibaria]MDQ2126262.1 hypothetical protein [Weissella cibaria]MDQ2158917.1 hypothetical protein [Weissella cibaria]
MNDFYNLEHQLIKGGVPKNTEFPFSLNEWEALEKYRISTTETGEVAREVEFLELTKTLLPPEFYILFRLVTRKVSKETIKEFVSDTNSKLSQGILRWSSDKWEVLLGESINYRLTSENIRNTLRNLERISEVDLDLHRMFVLLKKMGYDVDNYVLNMRRWPLGNFKKAISELDRVLGYPFESEKTNALNSDVKSLPQIIWLGSMIPNFANELISGKIIFTEKTYLAYSEAWTQQSRNRQKNVEVKSLNKGKTKSKVKVTHANPEINAYINPEEKYFEFLGVRLYIDQVSSFVIQRENYITKIPGKVTVSEPPFTLEEWNKFKQNVNSNKEIIVTATKNIAPRFARVVYVNPMNPNIFGMKWKQLIKAWAFKYLLVEFLRLGWLETNDIQNFGVKAKLRQEIAFIENSNSSTLKLLNEGAGKFTSVVNTKANVTRAQKKENKPRERLTYEERRRRKAQKYLNYLDDQMYYENHYVRPSSTRQRHNDGGGWS